MRTVKGVNDDEVIIILTHGELNELRGDIFQVHGEFCIDADNCDCYERIDQLADPG